MERVKLYLREEFIHLDLIIPESCFGKFVLGFGKVFCIEDLVEGITFIKKINDYSYTNNRNLHVNISFPITEKQKFFDFLQEFCTKRHIGYPSFEEIFGE